MARCSRIAQSFTPISDMETSGLPIEYAWELPWSDMRHRGLAKTLRYVIFDTEGNQEFKLRVFIDDLYALPPSGEEFSDTTVFTDGDGLHSIQRVAIHTSIATRLHW